MFYGYLSYFPHFGLLYQEQSGNPEENASVNGAGRQDFFQDFISAFIPLSKNLFEQIFKGRRKRQ
jgi:hypothetical protein